MPITLTPKTKLPFAARLRRRARRAPAADAPTWSLPLPGGTWAGMAQVLGVEADGRPRVRLLSTGAEVTATWALPYHYEPQQDDLLWVLTQGERAYVLGVARGQGRSFVWFQGDATLSASGTLRLAADKGVRILGEALSVRAQVLEVAAETIQERATDVSRRIKGLAQVVAGRVRRVTEGTEMLIAGRISILAAEPVKIAGENVVAIQ